MQTAKTPVSILQEMMVQKGFAPEYELIYDGGGTHDNTFTYRVSCDGESATGTGRCKKDAKHQAAKNILETIAAKNNLPQLPATPGESPVHERERIVVDPPVNTFHNAVGALQTLCTDNNLNMPKYILVKDEGPPHAKMFSYQCIVSSSFKEEGRGKTKKQAKHEAAQKMLTRLKQVVKDIPTHFPVAKENQDEVDKEMMKKYVELRPSSKITFLGIKFSEFHLRLKNIFTDEQRVDLLKKLRKEIEICSQIDFIDYETKVKELQNKIEELFSLANVSVNCLSLISMEDETFISSALMNIGPDVIEIAIEKSKEKADFEAMKKLLNSLVVLLT